MKKFRPLVALAALSAAVLGLTGCAPQAEEAQSEGFGDLSVQFSWVKNAEFAGEYFADSNGYYSEAGFSSVNFIAGQPLPRL